ncbi:hypothetical protein MBLNU13_g07054t2 [Cladosporium sp. NU13]
MTDTSPHHAAAFAEGGQDALGPPDTLGALNMHDTRDTLETSDEHGTEDPLSNKHSLDIKVANNVDEPSDAGKAIHAVLNTSELLEMILSSLQTKDLTRALTVSKRWQKSIFGSIVLKRISFLEPAPEKEYLYFGSVPAAKGPGYVTIYTLIHEPRERNIKIVELHPTLIPHSGSFTELSWSYVDIGRKYMSCDLLRAVHPATFLSQTSLEDVELSYIRGLSRWTDVVFREAGGMTFGALLRAMRNLREEDKDGDMFPYRRFDTYVREEESDERCKVTAVYLVASDSDDVETAREALQKAQSSSVIKELDSNQAV